MFQTLILSCSDLSGLKGVGPKERGRMGESKACFGETISALPPITESRRGVDFAAFENTIYLFVIRARAGLPNPIMI